MMKQLQYENNINKWYQFSYNTIVEELKSKNLLEDIFFATSFITYIKENVTFIITTDNSEYIIYQFSTDQKNILGKGKYATVYAGKNLRTGEDVAIKASNDDPSYLELAYTDIPQGWRLVKEKLNEHSYFAKVFHYGVDIATLNNKTLKVYLVMEKLELKPFIQKTSDSENIKDLEHLQNILTVSFDAITVMYNQKIQGIDWLGDNLQLDANGQPKFFDYDNWSQIDNKQTLIEKTNYSYSKLINILASYYAKVHIYSITNPVIHYRNQIASMKNLITKEEFFKITETIIKSVEVEHNKQSERMISNLKI